MTLPTETGLTRRQMLVAGGTFAGYAMSVDTVLAQAIKTDTDGLVAGDQTVPVGGVSVPVYEARPASGTGHPIVLVISEIWGVHEYIKDCTRRFAKAGYYAVAPPLFGLYGETDQNPKPDDAKKLEELLKQHGNKNVEIKIYPGAGHGFHADYRPSYNKEAADDAWKLCTGWFNKYLKA